MGPALFASNEVRTINFGNKCTCPLQYPSSVLDPRHTSSFKTLFSHVLERFRIPPPHVVEQRPQFAHSDQVGQTFKLKTNINRPIVRLQGSNKKLRSFDLPYFPQLMKFSSITFSRGDKPLKFLAG